MAKLQGLQRRPTSSTPSSSSPSGGSSGDSSNGGLSRRPSSGSPGGSPSPFSGLIGLIVVILGAFIAIFSNNTANAPTTGTPTNATLQPGITAVVTSAPSTPSVQTVSVQKGFGAKKGFWEVYFTAPVATTNRKEFVGGIDTVVAPIIDAAQKTLDMAAFEWDNEVINAAVLRAVDRGVKVRMVADNEHTVDDDASLITELEAEGVPIVYDNRSDLMHNKFMIVDSAVILTGSTNWTMNGVYRNYNNLLVFRTVPQIVGFYQAEFDQMFSKKVFGSKKTGALTTALNINNTPVELYFAPKDDVIKRIIGYVTSAKSSIRFMAFSFTRDDLGQALIAAAGKGVNVQGVFERTGSQTEFSEMGGMFCAGLDVRQDGYGGIMHHKVIIIDNEIVVVGSFNFSDNAVKGNDENLLIIRDRDLAAQYLTEFDRVQKISTPPTSVACD